MALANGYEVSERSRISDEIYAVFEADEPAVSAFEPEPEPIEEARLANPPACNA